MSSEIQQIEHRTIGYSWSYSIEIESVVPVEGTRASAKTTERFCLNGNSEIYQTATAGIVQAKIDLEKLRM